MERMRKDFISFSISNEETDEMIKFVYHKFGVLVEPMER